MCPRLHSKAAWTEAPNFVRFFPPGVCTQGLEVRPAGTQAKTEAASRTCAAPRCSDPQPFPYPSQQGPTACRGAAGMGDPRTRGTSADSHLEVP